MFPKVFFHNSFYFALVFVSACLVMLDIGLNQVHIEIRDMAEKREEQREKHLKFLKSQDSAIYVRRVTKYERIIYSFKSLDRGFAFSGEAGNAP